MTRFFSIVHKVSRVAHARACPGEHAVDTRTSTESLRLFFICEIISKAFLLKFSGANNVAVRTSGQKQDNFTGFLVQNFYGEKLPAYPILRSNTMPNKPGFHAKKQNSSIRQRVQHIINEKSASRKG